MTQHDLANFRSILVAKHAELAKARGLESIAIERSADVLEEADYKTARELAIAGLNRESAVRRGIRGGAAPNRRRLLRNLRALRKRD